MTRYFIPGVAAAGTGAASGGVAVAGGEVAAGATYVFGNIISGAIPAGGVAASTVAGTEVAVWEVAKAATFPVGYELGAGMVLSYGTTSQISAHTIPGVSDAAYLLLSLEGPRWVLYAIKGNLGKGEDLPPGAMLDLNKIRQEGEQIYHVPVSDEEMSKIVPSVYKNLPEQPNNNSPND